MNWRQLYSASTPAEREQLLFLMLHLLEKRRRRLIILVFPLSINDLMMGRGQGWGIIHDRRRGYRAHFIRDRRQDSRQRRRKSILYVSLFICSLIAWALATIPHPFLGTLLVISWDFVLIYFLLIKPRWQLVEN